jgi:hypothetical protein
MAPRGSEQKYAAPSVESLRASIQQKKREAAQRAEEQELANLEYARKLSAQFQPRSYEEMKRAREQELKNFQIATQLGGGAGAGAGGGLAFAPSYASGASPRAAFSDYDDYDDYSGYEQGSSW